MTVKEFYKTMPSAIATSLFTRLNSQIMGNTWDLAASDLTALTNNTFFINASKDISPVVEDYLDFNNINLSTITTLEYNNLLTFLFIKYQDKWRKMWSNIYKQTYNPIWNVDGTESIVHTFEHGKTTVETRNMTDTHNKGVTETTTVLSDVNDNSRYGFNSGNTPVGTDHATHTGSSTVVGSGNDSDVATGTDTFANSGVDTERTTNTRGGNIGVTSTQNMLTQEQIFREKFNYFKTVQNDIINELALNIYE